MSHRTSRRQRYRTRGIARACWIIALAVPVAATPLAAATAQVIPVKTVPVTEGDQFGFLPTAKAAMAVSIAVADSIFDPFRNPAAAARLARGFFFGAPTVYSLTHRAGTGTTLPIGALVKMGSTFGGAALVVQEIGPGESDVFGSDPVVTVQTPGSGPGRLSRRRETNRYAFAILGHTLTKAKLSLAASAFLSRFHGIDGSDLLYDGSQSVRQTGDAVDLRLGMLKQWTGDRSLEAVALRGRSDMSHDVSYSDGLWDPTTRQIKFSTRSANNGTKAESFGAHLAYRQAIADSGWYAGGILTANRTTHPEMPTLGSMSVSREPGSSSAFNVGVGLSRMRNRTTVGADAVYEPIWSRRTQNGQPNDDRYRFSNAIVRGGVSHELPLVTPGSAFRLMAGVQLRAVHYRLDQIDSVQSPHTTTERWNEWTHSMGVSYVARSIEFHALWRLRSGTSRPGTTTSNSIGPNFAGPNFAGPTAVLVPVRTFTEQFSITVPFR